MLNIKELRQNANITQAELAAKIGTSQSVVCRYENGDRNIDLDTAAAIARALNCTIDDLMKEE